MIMSSKPLLLTLALAVLASTAASLAHSQAATSAKPAAEQQPANKSTAATQNPAPHQGGDDGERIFAQNCSRCHNAPDGFSSRISGTVLRHMRVRASLSKHDEEELLRFFNP
jgi:cytochrome c5